jgi:hypothetical protein
MFMLSTYLSWIPTFLCYTYGATIDPRLGDEADFT